VARFILSPCAIHPDCTQRSTFASEGFDPSTDVKPVASNLQFQAETDFGPVSCIGIEHLPGHLDIRRQD
jgi:hypothetical protein